MDEKRGGTDPEKASSAVMIGNALRGSATTPPSNLDETTAFRIGEVASHELGHALGFESNGGINPWTLGLADFFRSNIMDEGQGMATRWKAFDKGSERNQRVIQEINRIGDNTPKP